jgi:conjugal transfer pilus assembly protein TraU
MRAIRRFFRQTAVIIALSGALTATSFASGTNFTCPNAGIWNELIGGVCWDQMFPIRIAGRLMGGGNSGDPQNANKVVGCRCAPTRGNPLGSVGFTIGLWQPSLLVEAVSHPFCFPSMGGIDIGGQNTGGIGLAGAVGDTDAPSQGISNTKAGYFNVHILSWPLLWMFNIFNIPNCNGTGYNGMNLLLQSEFYPTWNNDLLAMLESPEEVLYAGPLGALTEAGECAYLTLPGGMPIDAAYFSAGCWGGIYPMVGDNMTNGDPIRTSSLDAVRMLALGFRLGFMRKSEGTAVDCGPKRTYVLPKQQYRMQIIFPNNEVNNVPNPGVPSSVSQTGGVNVIASPGLNSTPTPTTNNPNSTSSKCAHWIGKSPLQWGEWDGQPGSGNNFVYLVWQWSDCCMGVIG